MLNITKYQKIAKTCCAFVVFVCIPLVIHFFVTLHILLVPKSLVLNPAHVLQRFQGLDKHNNAYVYSAYRDNGRIRLVGLARRGVPLVPKFCQFFTENNYSFLMDSYSSNTTFECPRSSDLYIEYIPEDHGRM